MRALLAVLLCVVAPQTLAQWEVVRESLPDSDGEVPVAIVRNEDGHALKIYRAGDGSVRGVFSLGDGYGVLAAQTCPSYFVDDHKPQAVRFGEERCRMERSSAYFTLGQNQDDVIRSVSLTRLMNGTSIVFWYHLDELGYAESSFSLSRSKQALTVALGGNGKE